MSNHLRCILAYWLPALLVVTAQAASPRELIKQGDADYTAGRYAEALAAFQQAAQATDDRFAAELLHNQAAAQFKLGNLDEARELWVRALPLSDAAGEARTRYNLGNCHYAAALTAQDAADVEGVLTALDRAIEQYRDAIRLDPALVDARANLELACQLKRQLEEQMSQQPQPSPSDDEQEQSEQQEPTTQPSEGQEGEQGESGEQQQSEEAPTTQPEEQTPQSQPAQQTPRPDTQPQPRESEAGESSQRPPSQTIEMTPEEAARLLQLIRDLEKTRRQALQERERARHKPVERDW